MLPQVRLTPLALMLLLTVLFAGSASAAGKRKSLPPGPPPAGLSLSASPGIVDVGGQVLLTVKAKQWPGRASVIVSFISGHHGFSGRLPWIVSCSCFELRVVVARRIHPLEMARASAKVTVGHASFMTGATFQIRGLARNGRDFSPGGPAYLSGWVGDPEPMAKEQEHFCAWIKTPDGLGVPGFRVRFAAHYPSGMRSWYAGPTNKYGLACANRSIGSPAAGKRVPVDIYAAGQHVTVSFTTRG